MQGASRRSPQDHHQQLQLRVVFQEVHPDHRRQVVEPVVTPGRSSSPKTGVTLGAGPGGRREGRSHPEWKLLFHPHHELPQHPDDVLTFQPHETWGARGSPGGPDPLLDRRLELVLRLLRHLLQVLPAAEEALVRGPPFVTTTHPTRHWCPCVGDGSGVDFCRNTSMRRTRAT